MKLLSSMSHQHLTHFQFDRQVGYHLNPEKRGGMVRGEVKYYFADFVRKGGGVPPLMDKIRKVIFEGLPYC